MTARITLIATVAAGVGAGVIGGVFFAFSSFVMGALARLAPAEGVRAMQAINVVVLNPIFLGVFMATAVACAGLAVASLPAWSTPAGALRLAGCAAYLVATFAVTMACNVPRNEALAALPADATTTATYWARYLTEWTAWNHVRAIGGAVAAVLLIAAQLAARD